MSDNKLMDISDFRNLGFLQEVNRQFFHPLGLALAVQQQEDGTWQLFGIWDARDDPEGYFFAMDLDADKAENVEREKQRHIEARLKMFGGVIQPVKTGDPWSR